jgi:O-antigen ligase
MASNLPAESAITKRHQGLLLLVAVLLGVLLLTFPYILPTGLIKLAVLGLIVCVVGLGVFLLPKYGLLLAIFYIYAALTYYFEMHAGHPIVVLVAAAVALNIVRGEELELRSAGFNWAVVLLLTLSLQSLLFAYDVPFALRALGQALKTLVLIYLVVQLIRTPRDLEKYVLVIFVGCIASIGFGFLNYVFGWVKGYSLLAGGTVVRFEGTHSDPNAFAVYLISAVPIGVYAVLRFRRWFYRILAVLGLVAILFGVFSTYSRGAVVPMAFVVLAILARAARNRVNLLFILAMLAVAVILTPTLYWHRLTSLGDVLSGESTDTSLRNRMAAMRAGWHLFLDHPFTGVGIGNFAARSGSEFFLRTSTHNAFLEVAVSIGIFGLMAYVTMYASALGHGISALRAKWKRQHEWMRHLIFYLLVSFVSTLFGALFLTIPFSYITWLPAAGLLAAGRIALKHAGPSGNGET